MLKELTVIQRIIIYSNEILMLSLLKNQIKRVQTVRNECKAHLYHFDATIPSFYKEIEDRIREIHMAVRPLLLPLFGSKQMIGYRDNDPFWALQESDLKKGYLLLVEETGQEEWILLLKDFNDKKHTLLSGSLVPKSKYAFVLGNINKEGKESLLKPTYEKYKKLINQ